MKALMRLLLLGFSFLVSACEDERFIRDPRGSYVAESYDGSGFPLFVGEDSLFLDEAGIGCNPARIPNCVKRLARFHVRNASLAIASPQYTYSESIFYVVVQTGATIDAGVALDAGLWHYDDADGGLLFVTQNPGTLVELRYGQFHGDVLDAVANSRRFGVTKDVLIRFLPQD